MLQQRLCCKQRSSTKSNVGPEHHFDSPFLFCLASSRASNLRIAFSNEPSYLPEAFSMPKGDLEQPLQKGWGTSALPPPWDMARPGQPLVMSHRAGGNEAPENTLAALRHAESAGSRVMQMDILPTADGTPVVFHDVNMKRATGVDEDIRQASSRCPCDILKKP